MHILACLWVILAVIFAIPALTYAVGSRGLAAGYSSHDWFIGASELLPGDRGYGKTVFKGTTIEEFDVEVLGVTQHGTSLVPHIIVRVSGQAIDEAGGIADGMSGSPVYFQGRLAGAISHVYSGSPYIGLVTPISSMLKLMSYSSSTLGESDVDAPGVDPNALELQSTLLVSGLSGRSLDLACSSLASRSQAITTANLTGVATGENASVQPGSAIAVQLVDGDVEVSVLGTVTHVDGDRFIAFGHQFEAAGTVDYVASLAEVICIMQSEGRPYKLGAALDPVGRITQDRLTGLAGELGASANTLDVTVRARDLETEEDRVYQFTVISDERFVHSLVTAGVLQAFDSTLGRIGAGTSNVSLSLQLSSGLGVDRVNTYSDWSDIALWSLSEISEAIATVTTNEYASVHLTGLTVDAEFAPNVRTARIEAVELASDEASPGDTLLVRVVLQPYRSKAIVEEIEIDVPVDASPGYARLSVQGGSEVFGAVLYDPVSADAGETNGWDEYLSGFAPSYPDLDSQLAELSSRPKSTDLVLDFYLPADAVVDGDGATEAPPDAKGYHDLKTVVVQADDEDSELRDSELSDRHTAPLSQVTYEDGVADTSVRVVVPTEYVVYGYQDLGITVETSRETQEPSDGS